jgi:hypothetical protein
MGKGSEIIEGGLVPKWIIRDTIPHRYPSTGFSGAFWNLLISGAQ